MNDLRPITVKHKRSDARLIRRVVNRLEKQRTSDDELLMVLLYLTDVARRIDDAFKIQPINRVKSFGEAGER